MSGVEQTSTVKVKVCGTSKRNERDSSATGFVQRAPLRVPGRICGQPLKGHGAIAASHIADETHATRSAASDSCSVHSTAEASARLRVRNEMESWKAEATGR